MCIGSAWALSRIGSGIKGMETCSPAIANEFRLPARTDMLKHRINVGFQVIKKLRHVDEALFDRIQPGQHHFTTSGNRLRCWYRTAIEHSVKVLAVPAESHRQRFQGPGATTALNGVPLNFPDNRRRHVRTFREFTLTPAKFSNALVDG